MQINFVQNYKLLSYSISNKIKKAQTLLDASLKDFLEEKVIKYNTVLFIEDDPISIPHLFSQKEDIEIAAFLAATIAWGNRKSIVSNARKMMSLLDDDPYDFVINHTTKDLLRLKDFVHRTFNGVDFTFFVEALRNIYTNHGGLERVFEVGWGQKNLQFAISAFKKVFFDINHPARTEKHVSDPMKGSSAKRINMFLRWMVRKDGNGVDFGLWKGISPAQLSCPLDVHTGNMARKLGLLTRKQNDHKAVLELDEQLRLLDPTDPVKYDFALFGLGVFEKF